MTADVPSSNPHLDVEPTPEPDGPGGQAAAAEPARRPDHIPPAEPDQIRPFPQVPTEASTPTDPHHAGAVRVRASREPEAAATAEQPPSVADNGEAGQIRPSPGPEAAASAGQPLTEESTSTDPDLGEAGHVPAPAERGATAAAGQPATDDSAPTDPDLGETGHVRPFPGADAGEIAEEPPTGEPMPTDPDQAEAGEVGGPTEAATTTASGAQLAQWPGTLRGEPDEPAHERTSGAEGPGRPTAAQPAGVGAPDRPEHEGATSIDSSAPIAGSDERARLAVAALRREDHRGGPDDDASGAAMARSADVTLDDPDRLRSALEAVLLVLDAPTSATVMAQGLGRPLREVEQALAELRRDYDVDRRGLDLREVAGGWRLYTREELAPYVERFLLEGQHARLTQAALETLAVVAYRQPVTRSRVSAIRGVNIDGVMRTLLSRGLVEECGADPETGGGLYRTTSLFLEKMSLNSLAELPSLAPLLPDTSQLDDVGLST